MIKMDKCVIRGEKRCEENTNEGKQSNKKSRISPNWSAPDNIRCPINDEVESPEKPNSGFVCAATVKQQAEMSSDTADEKPKSKIKMPGFMKRRKDPKSVSSCFDSPSVVLDFNQNVAQNHFAEASQQLLEREESLFCSESSDDHMKDDEQVLQRDYETLMQCLRTAVYDSFNNCTESLKSAVSAILQEEERDRYWHNTVEKRWPSWRPFQCRNMHDRVVQEVVMQRLHQANEEENSGDKLSTSLKKEVCRMGKRIQNDLIHVVRNVRECYTGEFDICNMYAKLYHQTFSKKLLEVAQYNIDLDECIYILSWIHDLYPTSVLQHKELELHVSSGSLSPLLSDDDLIPLEEKYILHKETDIRIWMFNALCKEKESWQSDELPELTDGYYISNLALDVITLVDAANKESVTILGDQKKAQRILFQMGSFLKSYQTAIDEFIKGKHKNVSETLKASLVSINHLRDYIEKTEGVPDDVKKDFLSITDGLRDSCHGYFLSSIHKQLKEHYCKLWNRTWLIESHTVIGDLLISLEEKMKCFTDLKAECKEELLCQLHFEVMIEYVRRMLKRKLKLKNKDEQEAAAGYLCEDSARINTLFIKSGSKEKWLSSILPKVSEVVRLQDPGSLQLEVVTLARSYPDISERQVMALLHLKGNLSNSDMKNIRQSLIENRETVNSEATNPFFFKVPVKWMLM